MTKKLKNVGDIIIDYLEEHGYHGLYCPGECACLTKDIPACDNLGLDCTPGWQVPCDCGEHNFHLSSDRPVGKTASMQALIDKYKELVEMRLGEEQLRLKKDVDELERMGAEYRAVEVLGIPVIPVEGVGDKILVITDAELKAIDNLEQVIRKLGGE